MMKLATVCTGIGSPEMALRNLGIPHEIVFGCEIDKYARQTYLANFEPGFMVPDMTKESWDGEHFYSDLFIGGIPCQAFSLAGKRLGELDPRGLLFFDFYRYVKNQNPKYFIIENVKGLLSDNDGNTFQNWINLLGQSVNGDPFMFPHEDSLMYNLHWQVLNTKDYGLPQNRERVFLIGIRNDLPNSFVFPKGVPLKLRLKDILEPEVDEKYYLSDEIIDKVLNNQSGQKNFDKVIQLNPSTESGGVQPYQHNRVYDSNGLMTTLDTDSGRKNILLKVENVGNVNPSGNGMNGNVFSENGISPTLTTNKGEGIKIQIASANKSENLLQNIGNIYPSGGQNGNIYDANGISPTLASGTTDNPKNGGVGSNNAPKILIQSATKSGYEIATEGDSIDLEHPNSETRRGRVGKQVAQTLTTSCNQGVMVVGFERTEEAKIKRSKSIKENGIDTGNFSDRKLKLKDQDYSDTILANPNHQKEGLIVEVKKCVQYSDYRIRKLTPKECFRLQGFPDEFLQNAIDAGVSNSQLYKQAGNSISVPVIQAILKNLLT